MKILPFNGIFPKIDPSCFITEGVYIIGDVEIGEGSSIWFGSVIRGDVNYIRIGKNVCVQDGTIIHVTNTLYPTIIGDNVVIGHRVVLHGCTIGNNILIGMGAIIMDGVKVGNNSIIAAGTLLTQKTEIPPNSLVMGFPGKVTEQIDERLLEKVKEGIENYKRTISIYRKDRNQAK